ncbi:carbohydrate ABC transporter permease [Paenibacillus nasutitermitis]|uniref:Sugar ABC transporter permease n=1 Tax=Paenibacillus nasutitermitis TaxID=1652958 RepID=A0A916ZH36_9BACL|nr:carbohydrate ABC transporter permease [Paenibacillus nasutitermitis]GGD96034.1 sugar ABC transporter permease [Paenibacillus nasutitermitis]
MSSTKSYFAKPKFRPLQLMAYILLILGSVVMLIPFAWLLRSSLMDNSQIFIFPPQWVPDPFRWSNFSESLTYAPFATYFMNTMTLELFTLSGVLITSSLAAYSFARLRWKGRDTIFGILLTTLMMPYAVTLIPTFILWRELGAINTYFPLTVPAWLGGGAFNIFLLRQFFLSLPKELDEAAYIDGAKPFTILWRIVLPLSKPALIVVAIFTFIDVWNDFLGPLIYLNSDTKFTLALGLASFKGLMTSQWGYLMAASTTVVAPIIALFFVAQRYFIEGISLTGIKG